MAVFRTPKARINRHEKKWLDLPWHQVRDSVSVKVFEADGEIYVLAWSDGRQAKENAMRRSLPGRDRLLLRIGAVKKEAGPRFRLRPHPYSGTGRSGDAQDLQLCRGQAETASRRTA